MNYMEAMESEYRLKWQNLFHEELSGITEKDVLSFPELPNGFKAIGKMDISAMVEHGRYCRSIRLRSGCQTIPTEDLSLLR